MALRNFWIEGDIEGRKTQLTGGPKAANGGFALSVRMRNDGISEKVVDLEGFADKDGNLVLLVDVIGGDIQRIERKR